MNALDLSLLLFFFALFIKIFVDFEKSMRMSATASVRTSNVSESTIRKLNSTNVPSPTVHIRIPKNNVRVAKASSLTQISQRQKAISHISSSRTYHSDSGTVSSVA